MNTPTKEQRDKIDSAIDKVATLVTEKDLSPSKAIAKVASAMKLTADYIPIIVRAYNTGAATIHREDSNTLQEKAASYPIAYLDEVMSLLKGSFPLNKKAEHSAPKDRFWAYSANIHFPDAWGELDKKELDPEFWDVKKASVKQCEDGKERFVDAVVNTTTAVANEASRVKYAALEAKNKAYDAVAAEMRKYGGITLDTARNYAEVSYGLEGINVIDKIIKENNLEKKATYRNETYIPFNHPFAKAFENFVKKNEEFKKIAAAEKEVIKECINVVNPHVRPMNQYVEGTDDIDNMLKAAQIKRKKKVFRDAYKKKAITKEAYIPRSVSGVGNISGLEALNHPSWVGLDQFERDLMYGLADPAHEAELRRIRVQSILTDLMNTDPYLKEKDPEEVVDALNDILEINPDIHKTKPVLRVALRQYMESGGMDIPTLGVLSEYGKEERERKSREKAQRENAAAQFASQQESARQADEKLRSEEQRAREDREAREKLQLEEQEFRRKEREEGQEFTKSERESGQEFTTREREAGERFRTREREAGERFQTSERLAGEAVQKELAQLQRDLQEREGEANRQTQRDISSESIASQKEIARLQRKLQRSEGGRNRSSQWRIADENRKAQADLEFDRQKFQANLAKRQMKEQKDIANKQTSTQESIAKAQRKQQEALDLIRRQHEVEMANQRAIWEQEAAKERDVQQRELQRQQQEWEKKLELAKAEAEALRTSFANGSLDALGIRSLNDLQDRIQGQFNQGYDTSQMSTPRYNPVGYTNRSTMKTPYNKTPYKEKTP